MFIRLIDFGGEYNPPKRAHMYDAGADIQALYDKVLYPGQVEVFPAGFGIELPAGTMGLVMPRSSLCCKGIISQVCPIDAGYDGEIHVILINQSDEEYHIHKGDKIGQLVIMNCDLSVFVKDTFSNRGNSWNGSTD